MLAIHDTKQAALRYSRQSAEHHVRHMRDMMSARYITLSHCRHVVAMATPRHAAAMRARYAMLEEARHRYEDEDCCHTGYYTLTPSILAVASECLYTPLTMRAAATRRRWFMPRDDYAMMAPFFTFACFIFALRHLMLLVACFLYDAVARLRADMLICFFRALLE